jgi:hypothetical protein
MQISLKWYFSVSLIKKIANAHILSINMSHFDVFQQGHQPERIELFFLCGLRAFRSSLRRKKGMNLT